MYGKKLYSSCELSTGLSKLANADINHCACGMGEHTELRRSTLTNDINIMHKVNDKSLASERYEQKENLWATLISPTQSPNLVSNSCYSKNPHIRTQNFGVQTEQVLIFWGIFSNNRLIRFLVGSYYFAKVIIVIAFGELQQY